MKNFLRSIFILAGLVLKTGVAESQTSMYTFSAFSSPYVSIAATGTPTTGMNGDDLTQQNIPIGFSFSYCGTPYNQLAACTNGFLNFANTGATPFTNVPGNITSNGWILPYWDDMMGNGHPSYYQTTGAFPNRVFTFQWTNFHHWSTTGNGNLQVKLYETSGIIDFCYGNFTYGFPGATIGISNGAGDFRTLPNFGAAPVPNTAWNDLPTYPVPNQVYRWSPCGATVVAVNNSPICAGNTVTLTATPGSGSVPIVSYTWSGPSGFSAATAVATVAPTAGGVYTVVVSSGTCTAMATTTVTVNPAPAAFTISPATSTVCGPPQLLTVPGAYVWAPITGLFNDAAMTSPYVGGSPTTSVYASPPSTTVYTAIATLGSCTASATATVNVSAAVLPITGTPTVCSGATTALASASPGGTWSSSASGTAAVSPSGVVTGGSVGVATTATITYTVGLCYATATVTVYPLPSAITSTTGSGGVCLFATTTLTSTPGGGTWSSAAPLTASVNPTTGIVTGNALGTATISYSLSTGCYRTFMVTVNPNPLPIVGPASLCTGTSTTYTCPTPGGFWSAAPPGVITINAITGFATAGGTPGTTIVSYTVVTCRSTLTVNVVSAPLSIVGPTSVCNGSCVTYVNGTPGGTWSSSDPAVGTINSTTGNFCGVGAGPVTITYALSASCYATHSLTVTPTPTPPIGPSSVCVGSSITFTYASVPGGTWSTACPAIATVPSAGVGTVNGIGAGTCNVTYTLPSGCIAFKPFTVNPLPATIVGPSAICQGGTATYTSATPSGTWTSSAPLVGTIGSLSGVLSGLSSGTTNISYTVTATGCATGTTVSVTPAPSAIAGTFTVCVGATSLLTSSPPGAWSSTVPATGTISGGGLFTALSAGTTMISFITPTGCFDTAIVTVLDTPTAITGPASVCVGLTVTLNTTPSPGTWSSSIPTNGTIASSGVSSGTPYAVIGGLLAGPTVITYTRSNGCSTSRSFTVNPLPTAIGGPTAVCVNSTVTLTSTPGGGSWSSPSANVSVNSVTGAVTGVAPGGTTAMITYSLGSSCSVSRIISINALPSVITAVPASVCVGNTATLSSSPAPGTWTTSNAAIGTINTTGVFTGTGAPLGTDTTLVTYTIGTGCARTLIMTVNALPAVITGPVGVCEGACTPLSSAPSPGTWSTSNTTAGTINAGGTYCGVAGGTNTVTYTLPTGCYRTQNMLVNPLPTGISPAAPQVCEGSCTTVSGIPAGGTWISSSPAIATITPSGSLCGVLAGTVSLIYTLPSGCSRTFTATVNAVPSAITGPATVCANSTVTLTSTPASGTWSSPQSTVGVNSSTGEVTGVNPGTAIITYTVGSGCRATHAMTVLAQPAVITATPLFSVCVGLTATLNSTPGGSWNVINPLLASVSPSGVVTGLSSTGADTTTVYNTNLSGCMRGAVMTVFAPPTPITGTAVTCVGTTTTLSSTPAGGVWTSSNTVIATVGSSTGIVTGQSGPLTAIISYTLGSGCRATQVVTVYGLPGAFAGPTQVCAGSSVSLSSPSTPGGTWSSSDPSVATVGSSTGIVTGNPLVLVTSTAIITYTVGSGCYRTTTMTVHPVPTGITGTLQACESYGTTTFTGAPSGGTWSSSNPALASITPTTGIVTVAPSGSGTAIITYMLTTTGCYLTDTLTVTPLPTTFTGPAAVCVLETVTLNSTPAGGTWGTPAGSNVSVNATTGEVTGITAGTAIISYAHGTTGCVRTGVMTVNGLPNAITGIDQVCVGLTTTLSNSSGGGSWSSSTPAIGSINTGGVVTGIAPGTTLISYTFISTGCRITAPVTVNQLPGAIAGPSGYCNFSTATYTSLPGGGTWTSNNTGVADFITLPGEASSTVVGTATITYTLPTGCLMTKDIFTIFAPYPITGKREVCYGDTIIIGDTIAGGSWSFTSPTGAITLTPNTPTTAIVQGISAPGIADITYTLSTGCSSSQQITVNPIPNPITGNPQVCVGLTTDLDNLTASGSWSSSNTAIATVGTGDGLVNGLDGGLTGNTVTITYALGTGCNAIQIVTVNPLPDVITGTPEVCEGLTTTLTSAPNTGTWTSNDPAVATAGPGTGIITGANAYATGAGGMGQTIITYTLPTGCIRTQQFTVNPLPAPITGIMNLCENDVTVLGNITPGGSWLSSNPTIASINSFGIVTGHNAGSVVMSYVLSTGCISTWPMTINANPDTITGSLQVCAGFATNLYSGPSGGVWSQTPSSMPYGTINPITGVVSGITAGLVPVSYTLGSGCHALAVVTVVNLPAAIGGDARVCEAGGTTLLTHVTSGGTWSSSNPARATVDPISGQVTGITAGTATITYMIGTGCFNIRHVTVNALPAVITGQYYVCENSQITLSNATPGGTWSSGATTIATIGSSTGILTGVAAGIAPISYILTSTGCVRTADITVNPTPAAITGNAHICTNSAVTYGSVSGGGNWINGNPGVISFVSPVSSPTASVTVLPVSLGTAIITYQYPVTFCQVTRQVTVQPLPIAFNVTGGGSYCAGGSGVPVGLDSSQPGVSYELRRGSIAAGYISGTGFPFSFGIQATAGVYTVQATNVTSGCQKNMAGSATVIVNTPATPTVTINMSPSDSVCPGETVALTATPTSGGTAPTYIWKVNGVAVGTGTSYSFIPSNGDIASVTMTSNGTCLATAMATISRPITVLPVGLPVAGVLAGPNDSVCEHTPVTLTAAPTYGGTAPSYRWYVNHIYKSSAAAYTYVPNDGDLVFVEMVSNYRCKLDDTVVSGDMTIYVEPMLTPSVSIYPEPGFAVLAGKPVKLRAIAINAGPSPTFQWKVNGHPVAGAMADTFTYIFNDYDSISCMVISSGICGNIGTFDWVFITTGTLATGQSATLPQDIRLHPNPNKGMFTVRGSTGTLNSEEVSVDITNMLGQVVYKGTLQVKQGRVDAQVVMDSQLSNGMYLLTLHMTEGNKTFHFVMEQ